MTTIQAGWSTTSSIANGSKPPPYGQPAPTGSGTGSIALERRPAGGPGAHATGERLKPAIGALDTTASQAQCILNRLTQWAHEAPGPLPTSPLSALSAPPAGLGPGTIVQVRARHGPIG